MGWSQMISLMKLCMTLKATVYTTAHNTYLSSIWATLLTHLSGNEHHLTQPHREIALVLQGS